MGWLTKNKVEKKEEYEQVKEQENLPSEFQDPFTNDSVTRVTFSFNKRRSLFRESKFHQAAVYFENGNSSGKQNFYDDDAELIRVRVENFINDL